MPHSDPALQPLIAAAAEAREAHLRSIAQGNDAEMGRTHEAWQRAERRLTDALPTTRRGRAVQRA